MFLISPRLYQQSHASVILRSLSHGAHGYVMASFRLWSCSSFSQPRPSNIHQLSAEASWSSLSFTFINSDIGLLVLIPPVLFIRPIFWYPPVLYINQWFWYPPVLFIRPIILISSGPLYQPMILISSSPLHQPHWYWYSPVLSLIPSPWLWYPPSFISGSWFWYPPVLYTSLMVLISSSPLHQPHGSDILQSSTPASWFWYPPVLYTSLMVLISSSPLYPPASWFWYPPVL
jgi:hypothetical protein